jgi:hypothetical protein
MTSPEHPFLSEPFLVSELERALAACAPVVEPEHLAWFREALATELAEDPELRVLLAYAHPTCIDVSGERLAPWVEVDVDNVRAG